MPSPTIRIKPTHKQTICARSILEPAEYDPNMEREIILYRRDPQESVWLFFTWKTIVDPDALRAICERMRGLSKTGINIAREN